MWDIWMRAFVTPGGRKQNSMEDLTTATLGKSLRLQLKFDCEMSFRTADSFA